MQKTNHAKFMVKLELLILNPPTILFCETRTKAQYWFVGTRTKAETSREIKKVRGDTNQGTILIRGDTNQGRNVKGNKKG